MVFVTVVVLINALLVMPVMPLEFSSNATSGITGSGFIITVSTRRIILQILIDFSVLTVAATATWHSCLAVNALAVSSTGSTCNCIYRVSH